MLEEIATVVEANADELWVETESRSSCSHCSSSGCSTSTLAKLFGVKRNRLQLDNTLGVRAGQQVMIGIPDDLLVRASIWAYLLPLLVMIMATVTGKLIGASEGIQSLLALGGLGSGFILVHWSTHNKTSQQRFKPLLLRLASQSQTEVKVLNFHNKF